MKNLAGVTFLMFCLLGIAPQSQAAESNSTANANSSEDALWAKAKQSNAIDDYQAYLDSFPNGKFITLARSRLKKLQGEAANASASNLSPAMQASALPPRPELPFTVSEEIWRTIEASEAYRNLPRPRPYKVSFEADGEVEYTGVKTASLPKVPAFVGYRNSENIPLGDKCSVKKVEMGNAIDGKKLGGNSTASYQCGHIPLGVTVNDKLGSTTESIEIQGSLFPMRIGAMQKISSSTTLIATGAKMNQSSVCKVVSKGSAHGVDPKLSGVIWMLRCESSIQQSGVKASSPVMVESFYLENLGVYLHEIGQYDFPRHKIVLPTPGSRTVIVAEGDYGSRTTNTYRTYEWSVGK